ncbi:hypothetical protein H9L01_07990 [Erysipelothrix inopinata]|uniref:Lipoprotein n=1 Tax=Erysipelothrix inopinata TaxID=225084 RepID=A0A7G9RXI0_9FIRM|nr:hypothetical protein [Erysipelothrix inopinata]QNN60305.1 hypothetical protein H9L01_07990 [Erysipelothrix inopinata]
MKRLISFSLVLMIVLVGCSKKEPEETKEPEKPKPTVVTKINPDKDYVYVESVRTEKNSDPDIDYDKFMWDTYFYRNGNRVEGVPFPEILKSKTVFSLDKVILNFKEGDSDKFNQQFAKDIEDLLAKEKEYPDVGYTYLLADYAETNNTISVMIREIALPRIVGEGISNNTKSYVFSKETGKLLSPEEILDVISISKDNIYTNLDKNSYHRAYDSDQDKVRIMKTKSECSIEGVYKRCEFPRYEEGLFITKDNKLIYITEEWSLAGQGLNPEIPTISSYLYK